MIGQFLWEGGRGVTLFSEGKLGTGLCVSPNLRFF